MKTFLLRSCLVLFLVVIASGSFFEWVLVHLIQQHGDLKTRLDDAFVVSLIFDVLLVVTGAVALSWPMYRRLIRLQRVVQQQQTGDLQARAGFKGKDAIAQLARAFDTLADVNAQQLENQRALLRAVSHELRTPVARLRFAVAGLATAPLETRSELRDQADTDIDELDALIAEILAYSRVSPGGAPREIETFDLCEVLAQIAGEHPGFQIVIHTPKPLLLQGEPRLLRRALSNLVRNAVHYANHVVKIEVKVENDIEIVVLDDGPGLPAQADERLFLPFVRYRTTGVGLGSSIAFAIAQRHGGSLNFRERPPGTGAEFVMHLPAHLLIESKTKLVVAKLSYN